MCVCCRPTDNRRSVDLTQLFGTAYTRAYTHVESFKSPSMSSGTRHRADCFVIIDHEVQFEGFPNVLVADFYGWYCSWPASSCGVDLRGIE